MKDLDAKRAKHAVELVVDRDATAASKFGALLEELCRAAPLAWRRKGVGHQTTRQIVASGSLKVGWLKAEATTSQTRAAEPCRRQMVKENLSPYFGVFGIFAGVPCPAQ